METNSHILKLSGEAEIPNALLLDKTYIGECTMDCVSISKVSNNDGTHDYVYKLRLVQASIDKDDGSTILTKDKSSNSQKLRHQLEFLRIEYKPEAEKEEFYKRAMEVIRHRATDILKQEKII